MCAYCAGREGRGSDEIGLCRRCIAELLECEAELSVRDHEAELEAGLEAYYAVAEGWAAA